MNDQSVLFETRATGNGKLLAIATLNAEKTHNALTLDMVDSLYTQLLTWQSDEQVVAVWLQAAGEKAFCAGGDVQQLRQSAIATPGGPCDYAETFFEHEYRLDYLIHEYKKPIICWGHGIVMGGGVGLLMGCQHRIVTERTRLAMPEITIALYPDVGGSYFLNRAPGRCGLYLALTAAAMNAADVLFVDFADYFIESSRKADVLQQLTQLTWSGNAVTDSDMLAMVLSNLASGSEAAIPEGNVERNFDLIQQLTGHDSLPAIVDAITGFDTDDEWLNKGKAALAHGSPLSACNIYRALNLTCGMALAEVFRFELVLSTNIVRHPEFAEGVRALLVDKDRQPQWIYPSVAEVPQALLANMVTPPWPQNPLSDLQ